MKRSRILVAAGDDRDDGDMRETSVCKRVRNESEHRKGRPNRKRGLELEDSTVLSFPSFPSFPVLKRQAFVDAETESPATVPEPGPVPVPPVPPVPVPVTYHPSVHDPVHGPGQIPDPESTACGPKQEYEQEYERMKAENAILKHALVMHIQKNKVRALWIHRMCMRMCRLWYGLFNLFTFVRGDSSGPGRNYSSS